MACGAYCLSQARCSATAGKWAQATVSRSLWPAPWRHSAGRMGAVSRLSSGALKMSPVGTFDRRMQYEIGRRRQFDVGECLADAFGKGVAAVDEDRDIGAQLQPQAFHLGPRKAGLPQLIECQQDGCGIRTAAAKAAAHRQVLGQADRHPLATAG